MKRNTLVAFNATVGILLTAVLALLVWKYNFLPDSIPTHFDLNGNPNQYSSRSSIFILWSISLIFYAAMIFVQHKPQLINTMVPTDDAGNPINLTKGQWQRLKNLNVTMVSLYFTMTILMILSVSLGIAQIIDINKHTVTLTIIEVVVLLILVCIHLYKFKHLSFAEDDYIRTKIESSHAQFLEKADNDILEQLRIINGSEYLPENKRMKLINDIKNTHTEVTEYIRNTAPTLSEDDITYCLLSSLGLNNASISACMASSEEALRKRKSRIRKKLNETLAAYLLDDGKGI